MHYTFIALALPVLGHAVYTAATPILPDTSHIATSFPVTTLSEPGRHTNITLPGPRGFQPLVARQEFPATLFLCSALNCASCDSINLASEIHEVCIGAPFQVKSAFISQTSNQGLPFDVGIGQLGCGSEFILGTVNNCFNLPGGETFRSFSVFP